MLRQQIAPEAVEILTCRAGQLNAHLETIGLHQVERTQHAVQAGEHAQMLLGEVEIRFAEGLRLQTGVDVAFKRQNRLARILRRKIGLPAVEAFGIQVRQLIADTHKRSDLRR